MFVGLLRLVRTLPPVGPSRGQGPLTLGVRVYTENPEWAAVVVYLFCCCAGSCWRLNGWWRHRDRLCRRLHYTGRRCVLRGLPVAQASTTAAMWAPWLLENMARPAAAPPGALQLRLELGPRGRHDAEHHQLQRIDQLRWASMR